MGEIEYHARAFVDGQNVAAIAYENRSGNFEIALFLEGTFDESIDIKNYLKSKLPSYMIPSIIIQKDEFPLNKNDKLDRNSLKNSILN